MLIDIPVPGGTAEAWLATPGDGQPHPGVLLFMDAIGLRPRIHEMADRIASWGYIVLAPNVLYRSGTAEQTTPGRPLDSDLLRAAFFKIAMPRVHALTPEKALSDIEAYLNTLTARDDVLTPVGVVGYCMGARLAMRAANRWPDLVAACAGFHGGGLASAEPDSPHLGLPNAKAQFAFGHADHDPSMDADAVARLGAALRVAGLSARNEVFAGARHGYTMSDSLAYDEAATERHFVMLRHLFEDAL